MPAGITSKVNLFNSYLYFRGTSITMASQSGFRLHVTIYIDTTNIPKFFAHATPVHEAMSAEPECDFFELYQPREDTG